MTRDPSDLRLLDDVAEHGFHALHIFAEGDEPAFSYSIGFWETLNAPEVIIFGLRRELMHSMLWEMFRQVRAGKVLADGDKWSDLIEGFDCVSRPVHPDWISEYFGYGLWHHRYREGRGDLKAFQIFWPGARQGLFPWDAGCDQFVRDQQPSLYLPRIVGIA
jgi:hypothetical protein